jgi:hypothetical protein
MKRSDLERLGKVPLQVIVDKSVFDELVRLAYLDMRGRGKSRFSLSGFVSGVLKGFVNDKEFDKREEELNNVRGGV